MRYQLKSGNSPIRLAFPPWLFLIIKMLHLEAFYIDLSQSSSQHFLSAIADLISFPADKYGNFQK